MPAILRTGATGHIDRNLKENVDLGRKVHLLSPVGSAKEATSTTRPHAEVTAPDTFFPAPLRHRFTGVDAALSLVHCMGNKGIFRRQNRPSHSFPWNRGADYGYAVLAQHLLFSSAGTPRLLNGLHNRPDLKR
jgi:hypothetical protein